MVVDLPAHTCLLQRHQDSCMHLQLLSLAISATFNVQGDRVTRTHAAAADTTHCLAAAAFLRTIVHAIAAVEPDTIDDWRTHERVSGCRITSAGASDIGVDKEAVRFYERLRAAKWTRTPNPVDSPNEGSLRFRWEKSDCLFNVNRQPMLGTGAESSVNARLKLKAGETSYQVFVMCMPAMPADTSRGNGSREVFQ